MGNSVEGKVIIVTGAGRGIGREIALLAAAEGGKVVVNDLGGSADGTGADAGPAQQVVDEIRAAGGVAVANTDSVADEEGAQRIVQTALTHFGRLDAVVNNAGILRDRIFHKMETSDFDAVVAVHLRGAFLMSRAAAEIFKNQRSGAYVQFTSASGLIGNFGQANYGAAKLGIAGMSKCIALDMERFGVRSNAICPFAWSRLTGGLPDNTPEEKQRVERFKTMTPDKIAPLTVYLCSDMAEDVTGQIFGVRKNEIVLFSQPRPVRSVHRAAGWSVQDIADHAIPALRSNFYDLERSGDVFCWDPI